VAYRVHDVYSNRILSVLSAMQRVRLHALPPAGGKPWSVDEFVDKNEFTCCKAATVSVSNFAHALYYHCFRSYTGRA